MTNVVGKIESDCTKAFSININKTHRTIYLTFYGTLGLKELVDSFSQIIRHPDFEANMSACYDLSNALVELDLKETEIFFHFASGLRDKRGDNYKLSFIYADDMTRMLVNFYQLFLARSQIEVFSTENPEEASAWLIS